jgi:hypothetical protein
MTGTSTEQRPGLAHDVIGCHYASYSAPYQVLCCVMPPVSALLKPKPEAGIGEPHLLRS